MAKTYLFYSIILLGCLLTSCTVSQTLTISGTPGTEIYDPTMKLVGKIQNDGIAKVEVDVYEHCPFLMSRIPDTQTFIPFALDYKALNDQWQVALGIPTFSLGWIGMRDHVFNCDQNNYNFKYLKNLKTNEDFNFVPIVDNGTRKTLSNRTSIAASEETPPVEAPGEVTTSAVRHISSSANRKIIDFAKEISYTYVGTGKLQQSGKDVETYDKISVVITRVDNSHVLVNVVENGQPFFSSELKYSVSKTTDGYQLVLPSITSAIINIGMEGELTYTHPKVKIDGGLYELLIKAKR